MRNKFLLSILFFVQFSIAYSQHTAQDNTFSYSKEETAIIDVMDLLEEEFEIRFSYASDAFVNDTVSVDFQNANLDEMLDYLLGETACEYKRVDDNILIRKLDEFEEEENDQYKRSIHLKGKIVTQADKENLEFATIIVEGTSIGTYTNSKGEFDVEIPISYLNQNIIVSYIGYKNQTYSIKENEDNYFIISMTESEELIEDIEIVNREKPIKISSLANYYSLNSSQILDNTSSVTGNNLLRNIQLLPGITAHKDNSSNIQIRGSSSDGTLTILDGIPIYRPSHYYGIFTSINSAYIDSVNIYKNKYPVQYSGKTGGIVEMFSEQKVKDKWKASIDLNFLNTETLIDIPINKNNSISISSKSSWREINNDHFATRRNERKMKRQKINSFEDKVSNNANSPNSNFRDVQAKYTLKARPNSLWSANLFLSREDYDLFTENEIINNKNRELRINIEEIKLWSNLGGSIIGDHKINSRLSYHPRIYLTQFREEQTNKVFVERINFNGNKPPKVSIDASQNNILRDLGIDNRFLFNYNDYRICSGFELQRNIIDYGFTENNKDIISSMDIVNQASLYAGINKEFNNRIYIDLESRINFFPNLNQVFFSPRAQINYSVSNQFVLKSSYSRYQQVVRQLYYEYRGVPMDMWVSSKNNNIPVLVSDNYMIGSTYKSALFTLDVEGFYKKLNGVNEFAVLNPNNEDADGNRKYVLFTGEGDIIGMDVLLSTGFKNYETYVAYTYSIARERYEEILKNSYFPSEQDRRHQLKWINSYQYRHLKFGLNYIYASGRPYTRITNEILEGDITSQSPSTRFRRLPAYRRMDLSATYSNKVFGRDYSLGFSIYNVLNTQNVDYIQSVVTSVQENGKSLNSVIGNESSLLNRTFNFSVKFNLFK